LMRVIRCNQININACLCGFGGEEGLPKTNHFLPKPAPLAACSATL
jgi:hypothetical protein